MADQANYDAFLARTAGSDVKPDYAAFLARTAGSEPAAAPTPVSGTDAQGYPEWTTEGGAVIGDSGLEHVLSATGRGMKAGFGSENPLMSPQQQAQLDNGGPLSRFVTQPILTAGGLGLRSVNALGAGVQAGVAQTGQEMGPGPALASPPTGTGIDARIVNYLRESAGSLLDPRLATRDIAALPEAFPTGDKDGGTRIPAPSGRAAPQTNALRAAPEPAPPPGWRILPIDEATPPGMAVATDKLTGRRYVQDATANGLDPNYQAPQPGMGGPQSVGAAASRDMTNPALIEMTPEAIAANRHNAEMEWLNKTNQPGVADNRELIPGVNPTLAQREQTVQTAREQKSISQQSPEVSDEERALADEHNQKRSDFYKQPDLAGSSPQLLNGAKEAGDKMGAALDTAWRDKKAANAQPLLDLADETLAGRSGKRDAIETEVRGVRGKLFDANGKLETDPEILYGVREHINDILSKENQRKNPVSARAQSILIKMRDTLDDKVIEPAAPGFKAAIAGYADDMKPLDVMRALQEKESGLFDSLGRMQFSRVHNLMRDVVESRKPGAALNPFQSMTDAQMAKLQALHDDLKRVASSDDLARAKGSDTAQSLFDASKAAVKGVVIRAANMAPVIGPALRRSQEAYAPIAEARQANALKRRGLDMLHPDPGKYPTRNALQD